MEPSLFEGALQPLVGETEAKEGDKPSGRAKKSIREKLATVQCMRSNEMQEALGRERQLSYIISELKRRSAEMEASWEVQREVSERKTFYIIRENECMKKQVQLLEKELADLKQNYETEISRLQAALGEAQDRLISDWQISKRQQGEREEAVQHLVSNLRLLQAEIVHYESENKQLNATSQALTEAKMECELIRAEYDLLSNLYEHQGDLFLKEREGLVDTLHANASERKCVLRGIQRAQVILTSGYVQSLTERVQSEFEVYYELKLLMLQNALATLEVEKLDAQRLLAAGELKELGEKRMLLTQLLDEHQLQIEQNQRENCENLALLKSVDDATVAYILKQRDEEVTDKVCLWKAACVEGDKLLRALLKRYQPFQRGDEKFVSHVIEYLNRRPRVQEPLCVHLD